MRGKYHFRVRSKKVVFEFDIRRNITVLKGDSATGKMILLTESTTHKYSKHSLDGFYLQEKNVKRILSTFPKEIKIEK